MREFLPDCHLVKLGTMGEYGTPNIDIEEGYITIEHNGRKDVVPFPKQPGSFYHLSKVHDSHNIMFACKIWGISRHGSKSGRGITEPRRLKPRWMKRSLIASIMDDVFGTVLNRFCVQAAIGQPLTVYGKGGQTRGFLEYSGHGPLHRDRVPQSRCQGRMPGLQPVHRGSSRSWNWPAWWNPREKNLACPSRSITFPIHVLKPNNIITNAKHSKLIDLGLQPHQLSDSLLDSLMNIAMKYRDRVDATLMLPQVNWREPKKRSPHACEHADKNQQPPILAWAFAIEGREG